MLPSIYHSSLISTRVNIAERFLCFADRSKSLGVISDRANISDPRGKEGSKLPQFTDVKMLVDSLLIKYQTNRSFHYEFERTAMSCTPYRTDSLYSKCTEVTRTRSFSSHSILASPASLVGFILILIDVLYIIP